MFYRKHHNYIFVHNPKAAGRSIRVALGYDKPKSPCPVSHVPLYAIDDHEKYFSFGFVRNPWDRLVSYYCYLCQRENDIEKDNYNRTDIINLGFNKWLLESRMLLFGDDHPDVNNNTKCILSVQSRSQIWWLNGCDFIGKYENLKDDLNAAAYWGDFKLKKALPNLNTSRHDNYSTYYNDETKRFVKEYFAWEIDCFEYTFN